MVSKTIATLLSNFISSDTISDENTSGKPRNKLYYYVQLREWPGDETNSSIAAVRQATLDLCGLAQLGRHGIFNWG